MVARRGGDSAMGYILTVTLNTSIDTTLTLTSAFMVGETHRVRDVLKLPVGLHRSDGECRRGVAARPLVVQPHTPAAVDFLVANGGDRQPLRGDDDGGTTREDALHSRQRMPEHEPQMAGTTLGEDGAIL